MKKILLIFGIVFILSGCNVGNKWTGFYYSDINKMDNENTWKVQPGLKSLEACREWVNSVRKQGDNYDYECGYDCKYNKNVGLTICKETKE